MHRLQKRYVWVLLLTIFIAALAVRFANLDGIPAGLYPDEAVNGINAQDANSSGEYKLFYEDNQGREGLFINLQALSILAFGNTVLGLKFWPALFGALTALGVFLLARELFKSDRAGLVGAFLTAFSYWAINFSRIGFRANMVPLILVFSFYFLFRGLRTKKYPDFILSGLIFGLGVHTYIAFRVSPLVLIVLFGALVLTRKNFLADYWKHTLVLICAIFITSLPMLLDFFYFHPEHYSSRTGVISVLNPEVNKGDLVGTLAETTTLSLAKYFVWGDQNWRHNYPPYPLLNPLVSIAFGVGLLYSFSKFFQLLWRRLASGERDENLVIHTFLLAWLLTLLIPEILAYEGNPHALRAIGTIPTVMIISAIPFLWVFKRMDRMNYPSKAVAIFLLSSIFVFISLFDTIKYFAYFANNPKQHQAFEANLREASDYIASVGQAKKIYVVTPSMQRIPIKYFNRDLSTLSFYYPSELNNIDPAENEAFEILLTEKRDDEINELRQRFPNLHLEEFRNEFEDAFYVLK